MHPNPCHTEVSLPHLEARNISIWLPLGAAECVGVGWLAGCQIFHCTFFFFFPVSMVESSLVGSRTEETRHSQKEVEGSAGG